MDKAQVIHDQLVEHLAPLVLEIIDESHMHGKSPKPGAQTHFKVVVVSAAFIGKSALERHRAVHAALGELLAAKRIHALSILPWTPDEWQDRGGLVPASPPCRGGSATENP